MSRRYNPARQLLTRLLIIHTHLILRDWHREDTVSHITQRLFALDQTNTVLFSFAFWRTEEPAARFTAVTTGKGLHKITRLNV